MAFPLLLMGLGTASDTEESAEPALWLVSGSGSWSGPKSGRLGRHVIS